jgi:hypothetical protein
LVASVTNSALPSPPGDDGLNALTTDRLNFGRPNIDLLVTTENASRIGKLLFGSVDRFNDGLVNCG